MVVYTLDQRWEAGLRSTYSRCRFWLKKIMFSDEAHFDLGGYVNKQNCNIWGTENRHAYIEKVTHTKRVTLWCGFWSRGIIGPGGHNQEEEDIGNIWFQQDGATCHTADAALYVLRPVFEDRIISRRADVVWAPQCYDFTPLDYYLWGAV